MEKPDLETKKILADGDAINSLVRSDGWILAKQKLIDYITGLDSISNIDPALPPEKQIREIEINRKVIQVILDWLREVEGEAQGSATQKELLDVNRGQKFIYQIPENKD